MIFIGWFLSVSTRSQPKLAYSTTTYYCRAEKVVIIKGQKSSIPAIVRWTLSVDYLCAILLEESLMSFSTGK